MRRIKKFTRSSMWGMMPPNEQECLEELVNDLERAGCEESDVISVETDLQVQEKEMHDNYQRIAIAYAWVD